MEVATTTDSVLDLCVRKREREDYDDNDNEVEVDVDVKYDVNNLDSDASREECDTKPPFLLRQQLQQPVFPHADPSHSSIMAQLQERIYADEKLHSPRYLSVSPSSNGSVSDTSRISPTSHVSPTLSTISRAMANVSTLRERHQSPTYFHDLSRGNPCSVFPYPVHLSPPCATLPRPIPNVSRGKATRPFKVFAKDTFLTNSDDPTYEQFRASIMAQSKDSNSNKNGNKNMKRPVQSTSPHQVPSSTGDVKDQAYWEKRRKNNEAAKRSRDARRAKEDELAIRVAYLTQENKDLKTENNLLKQQLSFFQKFPQSICS